MGEGDNDDNTISHRQSTATHPPAVEEKGDGDDGEDWLYVCKTGGGEKVSIVQSTQIAEIS